MITEINKNKKEGKVNMFFTILREDLIDKCIKSAKAEYGDENVIKLNDSEIKIVLDKQKYNISEKYNRQMVINFFTNWYCAQRK